MLNPLPDLLVYTIFAPALLRATAACMFFYLALRHTRSRSDVAREMSVLSHSVASGVVGVYIVLEILVGIGLFFGYHTQVAAIVGLVICTKALMVRRSLHHLVPLSRSSYLLLSIICISLLLTGAGAFAFDLPL